MSVRLERMFAIDAQVRSGACPNVQMLMRRLEVSERTVRADLAFLRDRLGAPLRYERGRGGYRYTDPSWKLPTLLMSEGELMAFFLSVELAQRYLGTSFEATLRKAVERLAADLPSELWVDLEHLAEHYTFHAGATAGADPSLLAALFKCVRERFPIEMLYFTASTGERKRRRIDPYHLFNVRGDWQVVAFDHLRGRVRQFAVSRVEEWRVLGGERFVRDPGFSANEYLSTGFLAERGDTAEEIVIWLDAYQASYVRGRVWHRTQQIEEHADGSLTLRFWSGALDEIRRWAMSFGRHAVVRAPAALAEALRDDCRATLRAYGDEEGQD
ncbi:MAG TPA: WYL domain-containing protein [Chloroflexaceae bacterium]|nr:WYL domain-containing protein [Chloroflexaceae bacterium]